MPDSCICEDLVFEIVRAYRKVFKLLLETWIGNGDERLGALPERLAMQVCNSMFGYDVVDVCARGHNACTRL